MLYFCYIIFALAPSIIWLLFFLRKDAHPESNRMVLTVFIYGVLSVGILFAAFLLLIYVMGEESLRSLGLFLAVPSIILTSVIATPILEEPVKYLVVRLSVIHRSEFDEPVDAMLYMIIAALGFAAAENLLYLTLWGLPFLESFLGIFVRFVGPTFLHALVSGLVGYYLALSFFNFKNRVRLICRGLVTAMLLHAVFNLFIIKLVGSLREADSRLIIWDPQSFAISAGALIALLVGLAIFVICGFKKVKQLKSVCKM